MDLLSFSAELEDQADQLVSHHQDVIWLQFKCQLPGSRRLNCRIHRLKHQIDSTTAASVVVNRCVSAGWFALTSCPFTLGTHTHLWSMPSTK